MDSPKNTALKNINQNIAEKGLLDKIEAAEKELLDFVQQMQTILQALESGMISNEQAQAAFERFYEKLADLQAELDGFQKELKEVNKELEEVNKELTEVDDRILNIETVIAMMMEADEE